MAETTRPKQFGPYIIQRKLGAGGVAAVYKAVVQDTGQIVALKVLLPTWAQDSDIAVRFKKEAEIVKTLDHPSIVAIYDYGMIRGRPYLAMRYMERGSLAQRFAEPATINTQEVVRLLRCIAGALDHAHRKGIIHRDLKLENILLDERGDAALSDFGIARVIDGKRLTISGSIVGTPMYMSPEQARGKGEVDFRADLYSLAVIAYLLTVGSFPFTGTELLGILAQHIGATPPLPSKVNPNLPAELDAVMLKGLAKNPDERYRTADAFIEAYARVMSGQKPSETLVDLHKMVTQITEDGTDVADSNPFAEPEPEATPDELVAAAKVTDNREQAIGYLKQALEIDNWHAEANRMLHRLEEVKSFYHREQPAPVIAEPLPEFQRKVRLTEQQKHHARNRFWTRFGLISFMVAMAIIGLVVLTGVGILPPGLFTTVSTALGGPEPVDEVEGVPIEEIPDAVMVVPPSQSEEIVEKDIDILEHGYNHEYVFQANQGEHVAIYVQFLSFQANHVSHNVAIIAPSGNNYVAYCESDTILKDGDNNITYICPINQSGTWRVRVLGRNGESTGVYFVGVEELENWY